MKSSTPYAISLSAIKLKKILDVSEPMDTYIFNMGVHILAPMISGRPIVRSFQEVDQAISRD
jgi:hypothetical protein